MRRLLYLSRALISNVPKKTQYGFKYGWTIVPHPQKQQKGGQDAVWASKQVLVVADGVGGWAESGIDPGLYSKRLVKLIQQLATKQPQKYISNPQSLITEAVNLNKQTGSTTVCILTIEPQTGLLRSYYLGDSVYAVVRPSKAQIQVAPEQQIQFNFPVQVGTNGFSPKQGFYKEYKLGQVTEEEIIVIGTDGLWDNMDLNTLFGIACDKVEGMQLKTLDQRAQIMGLVTKFLYSQNQEYESPFYQKAQQHGLKYPKQGKPDDVSIIVAQIIKEEL